MKLPAELLKQQFPAKLVRGAIIKFEFDAFVDPKRKGPGPKFAVVLNRSDVTDPIYLALATSKVEPYDKAAQFAGVVLMLDANEYSCWPLRTAIPFRADPAAVLRAKLEQQFLDERLTFVGTLTAAHLQRVDNIVASCPFIRPNLKPFLLNE
jgi:hypothetical protein